MKFDKKHILWLLVLAAIYFAPLDINIYINRALGMFGHLGLWLVLIIVIYFLVDGKSIKQKYNNVKRLLK